jgi:hypothetical protein
MKYVVLRGRKISHDVEIDYPIIFPRNLSHSDVSHAIDTMLRKQGIADVVEVVSAGSVNLSPVQVGEGSSSLQVEHRAIDKDLIDMVDYHFGVVALYEDD